jgi:hypothetical protein
MAHSFKAFYRFTVLLLSKIGDPTFRWTPRRAGIFLALYLLYPIFELLVWLNLLLDDLLYRAYRQVRVTLPVFIVGNFRSGTTFLFRLLAKDTGRFTSMKMWEILFAPSIVGRKLVRAIAVLDRWLGRLLARRVRDIEEQWHEENVMHRVSLREPEEDDYLLLHIWSALTIGLSSGLLEEAHPYSYFDSAIPKADRDCIMGFYRRCIQRHLYAHAGHDRDHSRVQYLAKNPALTPKLDSLFEWFPDARVICLVRNPLEAVPSFLNMMQYSWRVLGGQPDSDPLRRHVVDLIRHWYTYPLERLARAPEDRYVFVRYDDLVTDPEATVAGIYDRFGFDMSPVYAQVLKMEAQKARRYRSRHAYSLEQVGLTRQQILAEYSDVFERFDFDTGEPTAPPAAHPAERQAPTKKRRLRQEPELSPGSGG